MNRRSPHTRAGADRQVPAGPTNEHFSLEDHMSLFMDVHNKVEGLTAEAVAGAHRK